MALRANQVGLATQPSPDSHAYSSCFRRYYPRRNPPSLVAPPPPCDFCDSEKPVGTVVLECTTSRSKPCFLPYGLHVGVHVAVVLWQRLLVLFTISLSLRLLLFCILRMRSGRSLVPVPLNLLLVGDGA